MKALYFLLAFFAVVVTFGRSEAFSQQDTVTLFPQREVVVSAGRPKEEQPVGPYKQPEWTTHRRFPSTRVYVQSMPGEVSFEQWMEVRVPRSSSGKTVTRMRSEFAFGLSDRIQLDLYLNTQHVRDGVNSVYEFRGWSGEVRWAFADWNVIPGNPTIYFEYLLFDGAPDKIEPKLLLGGELTSRWHWGLNLIHERELASDLDRDEEFALNAAVSYTVADQKFSFGPAINLVTELEREAGASERVSEFLIGPSIQWRPIKKAHIDFEPLFGVTDESKKLRMFIVFGWDF